MGKLEHNTFKYIRVVHNMRVGEQRMSVCLLTICSGMLVCVCVEVCYEGLRVCLAYFYNVVCE